MPKKFHNGEIAKVIFSKDGETRSLSQWATKLGIPYSVVRMRYKRGKRTFEELLGPKGTRGVRISITPTGTGETRIVHVEHTLLDDLFSPPLADKVRELSRQANLAPLQVVVKIVEKRVAELLPPQPEPTTEE